MTERDNAPLPRVEAFGDAALLVTLGDRADPTLARRAGDTARAIEAARAGLAGFGRPVPAHATVLVPFDPLTIDAEDVQAAIVRALREVASVGSPSANGDSHLAAIEIPVRYGGEDGPDLEAVAAAHGLRPADVAELHAATVHTVLFLGFAPGFAYLGGLPRAARHASPGNAPRARPRRQCRDRGRAQRRVPAGPCPAAGT